MEAVAGPPEAANAEPRLLLEWPGRRRGPGSWVASVLVHGAALGVLLLIPRTVADRRPAPAHIVTPLIAPPQVLTQTAPNRAPIGQEFTLGNFQPRPRIFMPPGAPASTRTRARAAAAPPPVVPEPPPLEASSKNPPAQGLPPLEGPPEPPPPPQIQAEEKPKLAFETPGAPSAPRQPRGLGRPSVTPQNNTISEAIRGAARSEASGAVAVGDIDLQAPGGLGPGLNVPPSPGRSSTMLELQSNPMGVDFKPYLIRILAAVRRNWMAVIPESARLGRQGRVQIQFIIARTGTVPKLVIAQSSGTEALDKAAVAGVSASTPFPPLPGEFRGEQVRLQFTFSYNLK